MKTIVILKDFPGHRGIPGKQGGSLPRAEYHQDNPITWRHNKAAAMDWLSSNKGTPTAWFDNLRLDPKWLRNIPGKFAEQLHINQNKVDYLAHEMKLHGFLEGYKPLVIIEDTGLPYIYEGNHRIRAAIHAGLDWIAVDVRYLGGSETIASPYDPKHIEELAK